MSSSWEANRRSGIQEMVHFLRSPKFHCRFHKSPPHVNILSIWIQSTTSHTIPLRSILILFSHKRLRLQSRLILSGFPFKMLHAFLVFPMRVTYPAHFTLLQYKWWNSLLRNFIQLFFISSPLGSNTFLRTLSSQTINPCFSFRVRDQVLYPCKTTGKVTLQPVPVPVKTIRWYSQNTVNARDNLNVCKLQVLSDKE